MRKQTKTEMVRFRVTPGQHAVFTRRGGADAGREWLDNEPLDADMLTVAYLDGVYTSKKGCEMNEQKRAVAWLVEFENGERELHFDAPSVGETITPLYTPEQIAAVAEPDFSAIFSGITAAPTGDKLTPLKKKEPK
jgi:hypothetical protein